MSALGRLLAPDVKVAPYPKRYAPSRTRQLSWKVRYKAASAGLPLTRNERRILSYRDRYAGQTAVVIGNGPSLKETNLEIIRPYVTFGVNAIYLMRDEMGFLPTHYLVEDTFVAEDRADEINALRGSQKWFGNYLRYAIDGDEDTIWYNVSVKYGDFKGFPSWSPDASRIVYCGGSVTYLAMQLAFYMGIAQLVLVGFDHHYVIPDDAIVEGNTITSASADVNHFDGSYFGEGKRWHPPRTDRMEVAYIKAGKIWEAAGRRIVNATVGGQLDVFPRRSLEDALAGY